MLRRRSRDTAAAAQLPVVIGAKEEVKLAKDRNELQQKEMKELGWQRTEADKEIGFLRDELRNAHRLLEELQQKGSREEVRREDIRRDVANEVAKEVRRDVMNEMEHQYRNDLERERAAAKEAHERAMQAEAEFDRLRSAGGGGSPMAARRRLATFVRSCSTLTLRSSALRPISDVGWSAAAAWRRWVWRPLRRRWRWNGRRGGG